MSYWVSYFSTEPHLRPDFASLDLKRKCDLVIQLMELRELNRSLPEMFDGRDKNYSRPSHLKKKELMAFGELDDKEADDLMSPSLEKSMMLLDLDSEEAWKLHEESCKEYDLKQEKFKNLKWEEIPQYVSECSSDEDEYYLPQSFKEHIHSFEDPVRPSSYNQESFVEKELHDDDGTLTTYVLGDSYKNELIEMGAEEYREKMRQLLQL
uniref:uncharacterized protein LOC122596658 n=1 Tax=Erigeron canadensis TaxID=72917 RepID=UPI001CB8DAF7|nr:uncharacterized protein LOC122596658 [Erigeron canadensis]